MIDAMRQGHWLLLDELNAGLPEVLLALQQVLIDGKYTLVEHNNEVVRAHPNFRIFATMNPPDTYVGTNHLNPATLSRFGVTIEVPFPDAKLELEIIKSKLPSKARSADSEIAETVRLAGDIRNGYAQQEYAYMLSTRDLINWHQINEHYGDLVKSAKYTILGKCNNDDRMALESILKVYFSAPLEVRKEDGQPGMKYKKGNLVQVCSDNLSLHESRTHNQIGTAKAGAVLEVLQVQRGNYVARMLKGEALDREGERLAVSHRDTILLGDLTNVFTRRVGND
jgi:midasin (ATPase involved in ribosome maturation)